MSQENVEIVKAIVDAFNRQAGTLASMLRLPSVVEAIPQDD